MSQLAIRFRRVLRGSHGATAVEYGLIVGLIAMALLVGMGALGAALDQQYSNNSSTVTEALND